KMDQRNNASIRLRFLLLSSALCGAVSLGGCALLLGIEERTEAGVVDKETDIETNELCIEYCDVVQDSCTGELAVYASRASCINTRNALPAGIKSEPEGNTVECRLRRAKSAATSPGEFCAAAGPGGD